LTYVENAAHAHLLAADRLWPGSSIAGKKVFHFAGRSRRALGPHQHDFEGGWLTAGYAPHLPCLGLAAGYIYERVYWLLRIRSEPPMTRFLVKELSTAHWFNISAARRDWVMSRSYPLKKAWRF